MNFVFISPNFPEAYFRFCKGLRENGVNVLGIGDCPYDDLHPELKNALTEYFKVDTLEDYDQVMRAMGYFTFRYGKIDWVESNNEYWLDQDAMLRTDFNITTGLKADEISRFRSKSAMKKYYEEAGVPAARFELVTDLKQGLRFAEECGYPIVVKPDRGVGAEATYRLDNEEDLRAFYNDYPFVPYIMEEYIWGSVTTFDGICNSRSEPVFAASHITLNSIMDMVNEGVPVFYYVDKEVPEDVRSAGERVLKAFKVRSRFFHLEFFRLTRDKKGLGKKGDIVALEVNMRPAGGFTPDMLNFSQSVDVFKIWADMIVYDECVHTFEGPKSYCIYAGRRDTVNYTHSLEEIGEKFASSIRMLTRMPDALAGTMGNQVIIACFDTKKELKEFAEYAFAPIAAVQKMPD
ncbi:MAG: ATP-grasp domain-containing protein [bacterium]